MKPCADEAARGSDVINDIAAADKLEVFPRSTSRGVLTPSSAAVPAIVGVFDRCSGKRRDRFPKRCHPSPGRVKPIPPALAVLSFLISILAGVIYSYDLRKENRSRWKLRMPRLDLLLSMALLTPSSPSGVPFLFRRGAFLMISRAAC